MPTARKYFHVLPRLPNTRVDTLESGDSESFRDFVKYGEGADSVNRFASDDTQPTQAQAKKGQANETSNQGESQANNQTNNQANSQVREQARNQDKQDASAQDRQRAETRARMRSNTMSRPDRRASERGGSDRGGSRSGNRRGGGKR